MAITSYDELRTAVVAWIGRDDLTAVVPDFIALAEARINRLIRTRDMETRATASMTADDAYLALPDAFGGARYVKITSTDPERQIEFSTPTQIDALWSSAVSGVPKRYCIIGDSFRFAPVPDSAYTVEISYNKKVTALSSSNTSNWLLTSHPDIYLYGALVCTEAYLGNDPRVAGWKAMFDEALTELENQDAVDRWSGGPMVIRTDVGNP